MLTLTEAKQTLASNQGPSDLSRAKDDGSSKKSVASSGFLRAFRCSSPQYLQANINTMYCNLQS